MRPILIYTAGSSPALEYARAELTDCITDDPTEATHLLLPVPSFDPGGFIKGACSVEALLPKLPRDITIIGGNLNYPALDGFNTLDLLRDPFYVSRNAAITAHCALGLIISELPATLPNQEILILGFGRIGKCLAQLLKNAGARITVAARKETDRAMAEALGFESVVPGYWRPASYRVIINTVPAPILNGKDCDSNALLLDLASVRGISGDRVTWARGLPGKCVPETSGKLIAATVRRLIFGKESTI